MRKIPTLFQRDFANNPRYVTSAVTGGCEWVLRGEGVATRKWDGTCVQLTPDGVWWVRREVKPGKMPPLEFVAEEHDEVTGKTIGWEPAEQSSFYRYLCEAALEAEEANDTGRWEPGTYELLGPKINGNPEHFDGHVLIQHGWAKLSERQDLKTAPRDFVNLREWLLARDYEGVVWHHPDGRRAKLKKRDFD